MLYHRGHHSLASDGRRNRVQEFPRAAEHCQECQPISHGSRGGRSLRLAGALRAAVGGARVRVQLHHKYFCSGEVAIHLQRRNEDRRVCSCIAGEKAGVIKNRKMERERM